LNADRIRLIRHGLPEKEMEAAGSHAAIRYDRPLQVAFFGRLDPAKGAHLLIEALEHDDTLQVEVVIFGIEQERAYEPYARAVRRRAANNRRIEIRPPIPHNAIIRTMREFDVVAVPSQVLETGPLVVLEAFAAGVPVVGSKLGGIAELVTDGVNGLLIEPDAGAWAAALKQLWQQRDLVKQLRLGIKRPRSMRQVAEEMSDVYRMATT
jgi:glycosyltransferase involved in cell wall biosynthesis